MVIKLGIFCIHGHLQLPNVEMLACGASYARNLPSPL